MCRCRRSALMRRSDHDQPLDSRRVKLSERKSYHPTVRCTHNSVQLTDACLIECIKKRTRLMMRRQGIVAFAAEVIHAHDSELESVDRLSWSDEAIPPP